LKNIKTQLLPLLAVLAAAALGGSSGLYIKKVAYSGFVLTGFRMMVPVLLLLPLIIRRKQLLGPQVHRKRIWLAGLLNIARMLLFILAYKFTTIANAVVLFYLWPVFSLIISYINKSRKPKAVETLIIAVAFTGVVLMNLYRNFSFSNKDLLGTLFIIMSALLYAIFNQLLKPALNDTGIIPAIFYQNAAGAIVFLPFLVSAFSRPTFTDISLSLLYAVLIGLVAFPLFFYALSRLPVFEYSALCYMEVFFGIAFSIIFAGETPLWNTYAGAVLIVGASFLAQ
jgi:drug/metabolite transporter (DMT)-like permease